MSYRRDNGPGPIPNRWLKCPRKSDSFIANKFLAFKTPLSAKFDSQVPDECSFYPNMLFSLVKTYYNAKVGLWVDLTNTSRFYDRQDVEKKDCQYVKLQCRGFGETPSKEQAHSFIEIVDEFAKNHPMEIIGVHCTHGFNRTGFLIVSYMVERLDCDVGAALQMFAQSRPPGIYKQDYINELYKRYEDDEDPTSAPELPEWCFDEEETPDDYGSTSSSTYSLPSSHPYNNKQNDQDSDDKQEGGSSKKRSLDDGDDEHEGGQSKKKRRSENIRMDATFMEGVPGVNLMTDKKKVNTLQSMIQDMCQWNKGGFPGSQPVSMDRENIRLLHMKPYKVSWKADGTRYMMLIKQEQEIYFFDRDNSCFLVDGVTFPSSKDLTKHIKNTLLDGEMVIDVVNKEKFPRFLIYDIVRYEDENFAKRTFSDRLRCIHNNIISPRHEALRRAMINRANEPFSVRIKDFWDVTQARSLLGPKFAKQLSHEPDGLIFQPKLEPYLCGRCDEVLKWKPAELNSVDFKLKITEDSGVGILPKKRAMLFVGSLATAFAEMKYSKSLKDMHNKIVECKYDGHQNQWVFMRERTDKSYPNAYTTAVAVCKSIKEPVTKDYLLDFIDKHRFKEDSELMPAPNRQH